TRGDYVGVRLPLDTDWQQTLTAIYALNGVAGSWVEADGRPRFEGHRAGGLRGFFRWGLETGVLVTEGYDDTKVGIDFAAGTTDDPDGGIILNKTLRYTLVNEVPESIGFYGDLRLDLPRWEEEFDLGAELVARLDILPNAPVGVVLTEHLAMGMVGPVDQRAGAELVGRTSKLMIRAGYRYGTHTEDDFARANDTREHAAHALLSYTVQPHQTVVVDAHYSRFDWVRSNPVDRVGHTPIQARAGWVGGFGDLEVLAMAGAIHTLHEQGGTYVGPVGRLELAYRVAPLFLIRGGYERSVDADTLWSNFRTNDMITAKSEIRWGERDNFSARLGASLGFVTYDSCDPAPLGVEGFGTVVTRLVRRERQIRVDAQLGASWSFFTLLVDVLVRNVASDWSFTQVIRGRNFQGVPGGPLFRFGLTSLFHW
ncbi:MAG: hypothetical protein ACI9WU_002226, partial [Myxococcota bacterium]